MRQVPATFQIQPQNGVARLEEAEHHNLIGGCSRVGLHIRIPGTQCPFSPCDGELLDLIHDFTTGMKAATRIARGIMRPGVKALVFPSFGASFWAGSDISILAASPGGKPSGRGALPLSIVPCMLHQTFFSSKTGFRRFWAAGTGGIWR